MNNELIVKNANRIIKQIYSDILTNNSDMPPETILENAFDEYFIFETFFRQYFLKYKSTTNSAKQELINELTDTIIYNEGNVKIDELVDIVLSELNKNTTNNTNYKNFKVEPISLTIQVNDSILEIDDNMTDSQTEEKINEILSSNTQKEEPIIEIKENQKGTNKDEKKQRKNKKFFFG